MAFWEAIVLIVLIGAIMRVVQTRQQSHAARPDDAALDMSRDEVRQLKERIQVLERVITGRHGSDDLDREIERLRDR